MYRTRFYGAGRLAAAAVGLFVGAAAVPIAWSAIGDRNERGSEVDSAPSGGEDAMMEATDPGLSAEPVDSMNSIRVVVANQTSSQAKAGFLGHPESWEAISRHNIYEIDTRSPTMTIKTRTAAGGSCWLYVTVSGTMTVAGDPIDPACRFIPNLANGPRPEELLP